jgi:hypothetical protein
MLIFIYMYIYIYIYIYTYNKYYKIISNFDVKLILKKFYPFKLIYNININIFYFLDGRNKWEKTWYHNLCLR